MGNEGGDTALGFGVADHQMSRFYLDDVTIVIESVE